jgi:hypothetical protein
MSVGVTIRGKCQDIGESRDETRKMHTKPRKQNNSPFITPCETLRGLEEHVRVQG